MSIAEHSLREDVLFRVKRATQEQHRRLESILPVARETFSLLEYRFVLEKFLGIYRPLEEMLAQVRGLPAELHLKRRKKSALLEQDLIDLGLDQQAINSLPQTTIAPLPGVPEALGAMYVMEGATLGGQYVSRAASRNFGLDLERGCRFFSSYGPEVGSMWKSFGEIVRERVTDAADQERFIVAARSTFYVFEQWLREK